MFNTKCGCPYCKNQPIPTTRGGWKSRKNRKGLTYGQTAKSTKGK